MQPRPDDSAWQVSVPPVPAPPGPGTPVSMRPTFRPMGQAGFTLIELLVGMLLMGIVLAAVTAVFQSSASGTTRLNQTSDAQQEALNGVQLISARLKEAWYIYPSTTLLSFPTNPLIVNPMPGANAGTRNFTVGSEPVLAMIVPPLLSASPCAPTSTPALTDGCYRFYAYYGMTSAAWSTAATGFKDPGPGATDSWVIAEYRAYFAAKPNVVQGSPPPAVPAAAQEANLVTEDVMPALGGVVPNYLMFIPGTVSTPGPGQPANWPTTYTNRVQQNLRVVQGEGARRTILPSAATTYQLNIYPENIGLDGI